MSSFSFFWHDYETFGTVPRRDRPSQFAGVRTNIDLKEIDAPVMLYCQPALDCLPDPQACLLTGITPQICQERGVAEHVFAQSIESQLARSGTVGVGYNTIRFDDEVTRYLFWRNLIDPYGREWQNECGRWDILDVVRSFWAFRPEGIEWPMQPDAAGLKSVPSFKLELLTAANGLAHEAAHDALSDVRATIALARHLKAQQPRLWDFALRLRQKDAVWAEIGADLNKPFWHVSGMYPAERGCLALVWPLAGHPTNKNELIVWDLSQDPAQLADLDAETVRQRLFTKTDDLPEGVSRLPIKSIHVNKSPIVVANLKTLSPQMAERWGLDVPSMLARVPTAMAMSEQTRGLWRAVFTRPKPEAEPDVDEDLYGGFVPNEDRRTLERLRLLKPEALAAKVAGVRFADSRLDELLWRYRARNFPQTLTTEEQARWLAHCMQRLHGAADLRGEIQSPLSRYFEQIDQLSEAADESGEAILGALYDFATEIAPGV
jgi:exodeoxyribonuclease I